MANYPVFLNLKDRLVVIIGAGPLALQKAEALYRSEARLKVVAQNSTQALKDFCARNHIEFLDATYEKQQIASSALVIVATNNRPLNERIYHDCHAQGILCNVVDQPDLCDFYVPAVVQRGNLQIAISTDGRCPAYAGRVRAVCEDLFTEQHEEFLTLLQEMRQIILQEYAPAQRRGRMQALISDDSFDLFVHNGAEAWREFAKAQLHHS